MKNNVKILLKLKNHVKRYACLINDVTNIILKKERVHDKEITTRLRVALIATGMVLLISLIINIFLILK